MRTATGYGFERTALGVVLRGASTEEQIKESLRAVLLTRKGERALAPQLGSELYRFLFRPLSESLLKEMREEVKAAISRSEPRVRVTRVEVQRMETPERIGLRVHFDYLASQKSGQVKVELQG
jgi:uncharacterized protein